MIIFNYTYVYHATTLSILLCYFRRKVKGHHFPEEHSLLPPDHHPHRLLWALRKSMDSTLMQLGFQGTCDLTQKGVSLLRHVG